MNRRRLRVGEEDAGDARRLVEGDGRRVERPRDPTLLSYGRQDDEHVVWPFDGEFWRDEIGSYRAVVASRCGR